METTILLIRHGQTEWNRVERFRGRVDVPLNETGIQQAELTGRHVADLWRPVAIYSSPLVRAVRTAEAIGRYTGLKTASNPGLIDIDYGEWQSLTPEEVLSRWPEAALSWYRQPQLTHIPGGEVLEDVRRRGMQAVDELASRHVGQIIVLVGHTVINRAILLGVLGLGNERFWHLRQDPCAINVFEVEAADYTLVALNNTCHLSKLAPA